MTDSHFWIIAATWLTLVAFGVAEAFLHRRAIRSVPVRVHVNGTRGKTSVVRLIAAGLRAGGVRTCAKTSGTLASITDPEGRELPVFRPSQPNIIEQLRVFRRMARFSPHAIVIECMALQPHFQSLTELQMIRATHGVITNARPDHLDVMGPGDVDVARALSGTVPVGGRIYTCERDHISILAEAADDRSTEVVSVGPDAVERVTRAQLELFQYAEHAENVALALKICEDLGVDRKLALTGMTALAPEEGATLISRVDFFGKDVVFVHAFAANDPVSTRRIWENMIASHGEDRRKVAVVNCRVDRPDRSRQLAEEAAVWTAADAYVLCGSGTFLFLRTAIAKGLDPTLFSVAEGRTLYETIEMLIAQLDPKSLVVGMCNIHGGGLDIANYFRNRATKTEAL